MPHSLLQRVRADATTIVSLAAPIFVNNVASAAMSFTDTVMVGRLGARELAAVAVGVNLISVFYLGALGFFMALSPLCAHAFGAGRDLEVGRYLRQALWLALAVLVPTLLALSAARYALDAIGIAPDVAALAARYVHVAMFGLVPLCFFFVLRFCSEGIGWTRPIFFTALLALAIKVLGNLLVIGGATLGPLRIPAFGVVGCAVVTVIADVAMVALMYLYMRRHPRYRPHDLFRRMERPDPQRLREIATLALPICGAVVAEGALFAAAGLLVGGFGATVTAAHAIAINYAWLMFTIPLSLHSATTIHVGHKLGRGDVAAGRVAGWVGIGLCTAIMALSATVLAIARESIAGVYSIDAQVVTLAVQFLLFAAVFQVADGLQVGASGALRGFKDARMPLAICVVSYWCVGFPLAYWLGVVRGGGATAVWVGLIFGLFVCCALLTTRYGFVSRRAVRAGAPRLAHAEGSAG